MSDITSQQIPLGTVVAERHFTLWDSEDKERRIVVKLGVPVSVDSAFGQLFRCPAQILGLGVDQMVYAPAGEDAFIAMCYALSLIGQLLDSESKSLNLRNRHKTVETRNPAWVWQYMDESTTLT
jgi:hypothetical protein